MSTHNETFFSTTWNFLFHSYGKNLVLRVALFSRSLKIFDVSAVGLAIKSAASKISAKPMLWPNLLAHWFVKIWGPPINTSLPLKSIIFMLYWIFIGVLSGLWESLILRYTHLHMKYHWPWHMQVRLDPTSETCTNSRGWAHLDLGMGLKTTRHIRYDYWRSTYILM